MGQTLTNGIYLPNEGERNCYSGLAANWNAVDTLKGNYSLHAINVDIHVTAAEKETWNGKADNSALTAHTGDTTIHVTSADKQAWDGHVADTTIHVTSADKQAWDGHVADTTIHVTSADKQAWDGHIADSVKHVTAEDKEAWNGKADASALTAHTGNTTIHVTAEDKAKWDAVTSKADDSNVVHKSGSETILGYKTFSYNVTLYNSSASVSTVALFFKNKKVVMGSTTNIGSQNITFRDSADTNLSILKTSCESVGNTSFEISVYNKNSNNQTVSGGMLVSQTPVNTYITPITDNAVLFGSTNRRWSKIYGTEYYYGSNNVEFSTKFVTTDTAQTVSGNKTFSSINGVEPSSLSLPSGNSSDFIDISSYFSNTGTGETNSYVASANGWIYLRLGDISGCQATVYDSNNNLMWGQSTTGSVEHITIPILKGQTLTTRWATGSDVTVAIARFIPCQGNV